MTATTVSIKNAKQDKLFYFVANVVVYRESDQRCLLLKRHEREIVHPGKYGVIGGKLEWKDLPISKPDRIQNDVLDYLHAAENLLAREAQEEAGITIYSDIQYINSVAFVRPDEVPVILIKFAARYKSGDVIIEAGAFSDHAWVNAEEVKNFDCIEGIAQEVEKTIKLFKN